MPELAERIRSLSPGALRLFKQQLATLPETDRQAAFSKLSGIPELEDITGQPAIPTAQLGAPTQQPQVQQPEQQEVPFWMKALQTVAKPIEWLQEHIATPISAIAQRPFYDPEWSPEIMAAGPFGIMAQIPSALPGGELREKYEVWQAPTLETGMQWPEVGPIGGGPIDISTKHILELAPWLAIPSAAGAQIALRGGGRAAQLAARALTPAVKAERAITYPIAKPLEMLGKRITPPKALAEVPEVGMAMPLATQREMLARAGIGQPGLSTERMGLVYRNPQGNPIAVATLHPEPSGAIRIGSVVADEKSLLKGRAAKAILDELERTPNVILPPVGEMSPMGLKIAEKYQRGLIRKAGLEAPPPPPIKPPTATEAVPSGFGEPQAGVVAKLTQLVKETKPITKETLALRKPEQAIRVGEYERLLQQHRAQGVPAEEADRLATQALAGRYPQADITAELDVIRRGMTEDGVKVLMDIIGDAQYASAFTRRNTFQALQDLLLTNRLQTNQIRLLEETFGSKLARELLKKRPFGAKAREMIIDIANAPRSLLASCDISGLLRQGAVLFARRPIEGVQTVKPMLYAMFRDKNAILVDSIIRSRPGMDELMNPALRVTLDLTSIPSREVAMLTQFEEAFASKIMNKVPFVRASNRAFVTVLNDMRSRSALSSLNNWKRAGIKYTKDDVADLNQLVNWASGRGTLMPKAMQTHGKLLNALFFAPRLQFSRLQLPTTILPAVTKSALVRREAWRTLLSFVGAGAGILTMAKLSGACDIELNPRSADFGKLRVGETRLDIWAGYAQYMRFAANVATGQKKSVGGRTYAVSRWDVIDRFVRTKFSPATGLISDLLKGETYMGEDLPPKSAKGVVGQMYERMMPMAIQGMIDAYSQEGPIGILIGSAELLGIGAVTYTDEVKQEQEKAAKAQYGMSWAEVGKQYGRATQLRLEQTTPAIFEAEKEEEKRFATGSMAITEQWQNEGQSIEDTYREMIDQAVNEYRQTLDGVIFREKVNDASKYRRVSYASRAKREEYQDIVAYYNQPLEPEKIAEMNPGDVLRREYYQQMFAVDMYDEFGNYRFEEAELREQEFVKKHGQQVLDYIEEYRGSIWLDKPIELKTFEQAKEILRPYWKIADAIWSMYPPQLKVLADQIQILERTNPEMARRVLKSYPQILRARELIAQYRKMAREQNPRINQAYRMYYAY